MMCYVTILVKNFAVGKRSVKHAFYSTVSFLKLQSQSLYLFQALLLQKKRSITPICVAVEECKQKVKNRPFERMFEVERNVG